MEIFSIRIEKPDDVNIIIGQAHFIKTAEDIYETLIASVPGIKFGLAFCEASGPCLVRLEGTDAGLKELAKKNALSIGAGHTFVIILKDCFPVNVLNALKYIQEVCSIFCATANNIRVIVAEESGGRGVLGVIDGEKPKGVEAEGDRAARKEFLRKIGYKL